MSMGNTSSAVRNQRAPETVVADDAQRALWRKLDWFATPPWATRAGAELIRGLDPSSREIWEPAAGDGIMANVLAETFEVIHKSDIYQQRSDIEAWDFTRPVPPPFPADWIVTNPPFNYGKHFTLRALEIADRGVAMLCRLNWLESADRYDLFENSTWPLSYVFPFSERVPMQLGPWDPDCSTATAYAWFIWDKTLPMLTDRAQMWRGHLIRPGTRQRLTRADDVRRFCAAAPAPLFSEGNSADGKNGE
jgi:hypothetical protein